MSLKIAVLSLMITFVIAVDYCGDMKCPPSNCGQDKCPPRPHVGCENKHLENGNWGDNCNNGVAPELIPVEDIQTLLLNVHNELRNKVANGEIGKYPQAARMAMMKWDTGLAHLAELNVRSCVYGHDKCRTTEIYFLAGQNIGMDYTAEKEVSQNALIAAKIAELWFAEHQYGWPEMIKNYENWQNATGEKAVGHFTQFVRGEADAIGCAMAIFIPKEDTSDHYYRQVYLVCNYSHGNLVGTPIYEESEKAGSKCTDKETDKDYPGLCGPKEVYTQKPAY